MSDPPKPMGMSLYADLLTDKSSSNTISSAPVKYNLKAAETTEPAPKKKDASLQFQPIRRPQPKGKAKAPSHLRSFPTSTPLKPTTAIAADNKPSEETAQHSNIDYWMQKGNDHNYVRPRPKWYKEKKSKVKKQYDAHAPAWDDIYDPSRPNDYRAYKGSEEQRREISEWKDRLYFRADSIKRESKVKSSDVVERTTIYDDATGEDAFARRAQMSSSDSSDTRGLSAKLEMARANAALMEARIAARGPEDAGNEPTSTGLGATISREPLRYVHADQSSIPEPEPPFKPRKAGFGQRMLEKQGWKEGMGLGVHREGITTAITVQPEKRKKKSDAEGGGFGPRNMGKIIGGKRRKIEGQDDESKMSNVVKIPGMLAGLDVKQEIEEKNLLQELGGWFDENYGKVERVHIWRKEQGGNDEVFIRFTQEISALKAVNPSDVLTFANNVVEPAFFDAAKFDKGDYT